jgi:hypothetical protein
LRIGIDPFLAWFQGLVTEASHPKRGDSNRTSFHSGDAKVMVM